MKRIISFFLGTASFFLPQSVGLAVDMQGVFLDVTGVGHQYQEGVTDIVSLGIMQGNPDGTFRPDAPMNRAEFAKTVVTSIGAASDGAACLQRMKGQFWDVKKDAWYAPFVCIATERGIITGYPDGSFRPANSVRFVEAAAMLTRAGIGTQDTAEISNEDTSSPETLSFGDVLTTWLDGASFQAPSSTEKPWFQDAVERLAQKNAIPVSIVSFDAQLTRAEIAEILHRILSASERRESQTYRTLPCDVEARVAYSLKDALARANQICELELSSATVAELNAALPSLPFVTRIAVHGGLNAFPESILQLPRLVELDLSGNKISSLPNEIRKLTALEHVNISENMLTELPQNIGALSELSFLSLESNELTTFPDSIANAMNLLEINAENNNFSEAEMLSIQKKFPNINIRF